MPELPEVEVLKRSLSRNIRSKKIIRVKINNPNLRYKIPKNLTKYLKNKVVKNVLRIAKYLILDFGINKKKLLIHLGMSGTIHLVRKNNKLNTNASFYSYLDLPIKHNHVEIFLNHNLKLIYNDPRRFGFIKFLDEYFIRKKSFNNLGPDPFNKEFNHNYIKNYIKNKKKNLKNLLMDQKFVGGIGNIYANEIIFNSKINPKKSISKLTHKNMHDIIKNTKRVLKKAIYFGGSSIQNFSKVNGELGNFQQKFMVYGKDNKKCLRNKCKGILKKVIISNRSTFFCPICQIN